MQNNTIHQFHRSTYASYDKAVRVLNVFFKKLILGNESPAGNREEVSFWKNRIYYVAAVIMLIFGAPLLFYGAYVFYRDGSTVNAVLEASIYIVYAIVITSKWISTTLKKYYMIYKLYLISIFLLLTTGSLGAGMVCVSFVLILVGCLMDKKRILLLVTINIFVFLILTILLYNGFFDGTPMETYKKVWIIDAMTAQACGIILVIPINSIFTGLERQAQRIKKSEASLAASETKHKSMISNISDAIVILDKEGIVTYNSPNMTQRFPWMSKDILHSLFYEKIHPEDRAFVAETIRGLLNAQGMKKTIEARYLDNNNELGYLELTAVNLTEDENIGGILINYSDITDRKIREQEIIYLNQHDNLTGLYNRFYYEMAKDKLDKPEQLPFSIIVGDVNGLKIINDSLGHSEGDRLLITIANIIQKSCRKQDIAARIGGDEFNILLPRTDSAMALEIINRINTECKEYNSKTSGELYHISISLGASTKVYEKESLDIVQKVAEDFMYKRKLLEGRSFHSSVINSMKMALFEKSFETEKHTHRINRISKEIGKIVGLTNQQFDELELLSELHDIGKIGIDNEILNKPAALSKEEWVKMRKHSDIGYRIAMASPELMSIAYLIMTHHERWDGKGYPQGLEGESIPLLSRVIAVADSYDAMTQDRPYRKAMSKQAAIEEIKLNSGTQFDPYLAAIFINLIEEDKIPLT